MNTEDIINNIIMMLLEDAVILALSLILITVVINLYFWLVYKILGEDYLTPFLFVPGSIIFPILAYFCFYTRIWFTIILGIFFILLFLCSVALIIFSWPSEKKEQILEVISSKIHHIIIGDYPRKIGIENYEYIQQDIFRNKFVVIKPRKEYCFIRWNKKKIFFNKEDISKIDYYIGKKGTFYGKFVFWDKDGNKLASMDMSGFGPWDRFYNEMTGLQGVDLCKHNPKRKGESNAKKSRHT